MILNYCRFHKTLEECIDILSLYNQCDIFIQLNNKFQGFKQTVDIDPDYIIEQKEKEIDNLKELTKKSTLSTLNIASIASLVCS